LTEATVTSQLAPRTAIGCEAIAESLAAQLDGAPMMVEQIAMFLFTFTRYYATLLEADPGEMVTTVTGGPIGEDMQITRMECRVKIGAVTLTTSYDQDLRMRK
jgi:hypothetical protein